jgi:hypothetical protein
MDSPTDANPHTKIQHNSSPTHTLRRLPASVVRAASIQTDNRLTMIMITMTVCTFKAVDAKLPKVNRLCSLTPERNNKRKPIKATILATWSSLSVILIQRLHFKSIAATFALYDDRQSDCELHQVSLQIVAERNRLSAIIV